MSKQILGKATSSMLIFFLVVNPHYTLSRGEYGDICSRNVDCMSADTQNPLICIGQSEGTTTTVSVPTTTTEEAATTTEEATTTTEEAATTTEEAATTTEEAATTTKEAATTTEEAATTTEEEATTTEDPTSMTQDPTSTTEDATSITQDATSTTQDATSTTEQSTTDTDASAEPMDSFDYNFDNFGELKWTSPPVCGCPSDMIRDFDLQRCVSPPYGICDLRYEDGNYKRGCTKFAHCYPEFDDKNSATGTCYCDQDATEDLVAGTCRLGYGSTKCKQHTDCDIRNLLTCHNNICVCMYQDLQRWNPTEKKCGFVVGESCADIAPFPTSVCVENAVCTNETKKCSCDGDYMATSEGECKLSHNAPCGNDNDCHPYFKCSAGKCTCPEDQIYYASTRKCHIPEGSPCDTSIIDSCTLGAECKNEICACQSGYQATSEHTCHALVNSKCSDEVPCHLDQYMDVCNTTHPYCECVENYRYSAASDRCVGNVDETCKEDEDCTDHAICMPNGKCLCGGDYIPGENKTACYTHYGRSCSTIGCYPGHFLKCNANDFTCVCASSEHQTFDESKGYCVALAGRFCGGSANGIQCVENSLCGVENLDTKCKCLVGYAANNLGFCIKSDEISAAGHLKIGKAYLHTLLLIFSLIILES